MDGQNVEIIADNVGGEATIAAMDEYQYTNIGQQTYYFVRRILRDPEMRKLHAQKKAELEASGYFDKLREAFPSGDCHARA